MKRILSLLLASVMLFALAACSSDKDDTQSQTEDTTVDAEVVEENQESPEEPETVEYVYGTATLTYAEFYAGDVSSVDSFDAVSSATNSKYSIMPNMATDFVDEATNADGYHITGVANVNIAVATGDAEALAEINDTFVLGDGTVPTQYKIAEVSDGAVSYSATVFNVADTVTDATAELITGGTWGDYQINVYDGATVHLRNDRTDEFDINSEIMGIILETQSGLKVGMEALQSIWVQPYEVSFNVLSDNTHNTHIAAYDNLTELTKLVGETVVRITYIMPNETYVYEFEGIYIKPTYEGEITADATSDYSEITLSTSSFADFENGRITVTYTVGSGRNSTAYTILETELLDGTAAYKADITEVSALEDQSGKYSVKISSDNYADITVSLPASDGQISALNALIAKGNDMLAQEENETLAEHVAEANELIADENSTSDDIATIIAELTQLTSDQQEGQGGQGGQGGHGHS